ncbi:MAG: phosphate ABC transporter permease subunit PstC [Candidatus Cloacimonadales bacterium]|mgnify:CR=1 FL=1|jgi:phosphate transport system permease protein|nr:phosphate ABC transporter permease subunit PstC [Candidatus Cloacimonadota bacterium]MDY0381606.1 phosphate ABC transporter permease subunit PstC [Candidatus Cloacimonadaceae bacterium]MCB5264408.1 phosphate ABC transporter permease subunit PstC [Candidatus Cloacimonadota bacterium]MCK9434245.1 phosphate ABC transporter permease subunit PstC [Candidatus Cloacimonadota bacterium]MDD3548028.1 phosphate ABC transporter permease subunit PstC [Candidatus Cloacimonadota bacterium]
MHAKERAFVAITHTAALFSLTAVFGIIYSIFREGIPLFDIVPLSEVLFGNDWYPTHAEAPQFGILNLFAGSLLVTLGALIIAIPLGLGSAIFISEIASPKLKEIAKPVLELLAAIPSVVYGLFGMVVLAPFVRELFDLSTGLNLFSSSIILGLMVLPIISSMSEDALANVAKQLREASLALGATSWETITKVVIPAARRGIVGSILQGFGRAIGETMVVLMVAGGSAQIPKSIFESIRPLTSTIAAEMGETVVGDLHYRSLFAIACLLFIITLITNLSAELIFFKRNKK